MTTPVTNSRRSFIWKLGAGASAAVASTVGAARESPPADSTSLRLAMLEEENALRQLHSAFEQAMDSGHHDEVIGMFADDARVVFNGGVFLQEVHGVTRLYRDHFAAGRTGTRMEPAPGFGLGAGQQRDSVEVSADRRSAKAAFTYSIKVGMPFETESSLASMARLQGEGMRTWWEGGIYQVAYRRDAAGAWKIGRLEYNTLSRADWRSGRSHAQPIAASHFAMRFPQDQRGPDALV